MKAWTNYKEQEEDAAFYRHLDGECGDLDAGCKYCKAIVEEAKNEDSLEAGVKELQATQLKFAKQIAEIEALVKKMFG